MLSVDKLTRAIITGMAPHLHHQRKWAQVDGGLRCQECEQVITGPKIFAASGMLDDAGRDRVREAVSRWIRKHSPDSARVIVKL